MGFAARVTPSDYERPRPPFHPVAARLRLHNGTMGA